MTVEEHEPWAPAPESDGTPASARSAVFQALGAASMCWEDTPSGVFDSTRARDIGDALVAYLGLEEEAR